MQEQPRLKGDDWQAVLHAPFRVYAIIATVDAPASPAQFSQLLDELRGAREAFPAGTIGAAVISELTTSEEQQWARFQESSWSLEDGLKRARKALGKLPDAESEALRDWLMGFATRVAQARRVVGSTPISEGEAEGLALVAGLLDRTMPAVPVPPEGSG